MTPLKISISLFVISFYYQLALSADQPELPSLTITASPQEWFNYENLAVDYYEEKDYESSLVNSLQALNFLEDSVEVDTEYTLKARKRLVKKIAKTYRKLGNYHAALYIFQIEVARNPDADWAVQKIGQWMLKYGHRKVGIRWLKRATDMQGSPDGAWQKLGSYLRNKSSLYRYVRYLREGRDRFPYLASSWDRLAAGLLEDDRFFEAQRIIAKALTLFQAQSLWRTARSSLGQGLLAQYAHPLKGKQFTAMGCGPYGVEDELALKHYMKAEKAVSNSAFIIHLGDLGKGISEVPESRYVNMADILSLENAKPTFVVLGDNDWNDTADPAQSLGFWKRHLGKFYQRFDLPFNVKTQFQRDENFSFKLDDVEYIGINLPEGKVHDEIEWKKRITDNGEWIQHSLRSSNARAAVILAHAPADVFNGQLLDSLQKSAIEFAKPVLFLHANGHRWFYRKSLVAPNITHLQLNKIYDEAPYYPPVQIRYTGRNDLPFVIDRRIGSPAWQLQDDR